jgi:hypothetical protein
LFAIVLLIFHLISQNFFSKAASLIIESRIKVKHIRGANGARKTSKWVSIVTVNDTHTETNFTDTHIVPD